MSLSYTIEKSYLILSLLLLLTFQSSFSQDTSKLNPNRWAIGLKTNNAISIKKYSGNKALELLISRPNPWRYNSFYYNSYRGDFKNSKYTYDGYDNIYRPWALQLRYVVHKDIFVLPGLSWYYGLGGQVRTSSYYYNYYYQDGANTVYGREKVNSFGIGADIVGGLEYNFKNAPLSVFYDMDLYAEAFQHPLYCKIQGAVGARFVF
jgi:hypothetical protein